ncbi:ion transporter [Shimwellia blattae]|uniref:Ion transport protein n=1 Tax=Shimwellia blattae (strain ATCC 29907 / DSM 4481 / JCM 1650 / NBRC 105725 / CDC 9005-74) TaxID=630626 RepID=I2B8Z4_SHIBC|nr:ion transport protein [Shimwellia blattae DSM 4481 = NBRC 105725]GAB80879.1 putative transporter [Shimwellia blattae DSM 4481 = NBRC 105725]VDY64492.1 voltage-gated potassium channel [Shimwellia blattae]VEC22600.1 voltage-gated potassium channel [Shimwellia blattae]
MPGTRRTLRQRSYDILLDQTSPHNRRFEIAFGVLDILSVLVIFLETGLASGPGTLLARTHLFEWAELFFTLAFSIEYLLRVISTPRPWRYIFSFWGFVDLATTIPLYVFWLWPEIGAEYVSVWRAMRAIRALRIMKLLRLMPTLNSFWQAVLEARHQLFLFYFFIGIVMVVAGSLMYGIEGPAHGFTSLGVAVYWAIVTVTTVGYGDIAPHTTAGRIVSSILILIGYSVIAIPTGLITAQVTRDIENRRHSRACVHCNHAGHDSNARFCKCCGHRLPVR